MSWLRQGRRTQKPPLHAQGFRRQELHTWVPSWSHLSSSSGVWPYKLENLMLWMCSKNPGLMELASTNQGHRVIQIRMPVCYVHFISASRCHEKPNDNQKVWPKKTSGRQDHLRGLSTEGHCRPCASCLRWPSPSLFLVILLRSAQTHLPQDPPATPSVGFPTAYTFSLPPAILSTYSNFH